MEELLALLGIGGGGLLVGDAYNSLGNVGDTAWDRTQNIGEDIYNRTQFTGYGVTSPAGKSTVDAQGNLNNQLSLTGAQQQDWYNSALQSTLNPFGPLAQYSNQNLSAAQGMLPGLSGVPADREQDIYNRIRAMQTPEEQSQRLALESRLAAQGRTGVRTGSYGGTPEQYALAKAQEQAQNEAAYRAIELARQQQAQDANIYGMLGSAGLSGLSTQGQLAGQYGTMYQLPMQALLDQLGAGTQAYGYEDIARRQAAGNLSNTRMAGLDALLGSRLGQANLSGQIGSALLSGGMGMLGGAISSGVDNIGDLLSGAWQGLFG